MERTVEIVKKEYELSLEESNKHFQNAPLNMGFDEFEEYMSLGHEKSSKLSRELRMIMVPEFDNLSDYGSVMTLESFIENCNAGGFIDYDGFGKYIKDDKESNILIYPSDVQYDTIRSDFDTIIWFNR